MFVVVLAHLIYRYIQAKKKEPKTDANEFLIESDDMSHASAELDVDIRYRPAPNHFRIHETFDTRYTDSEYEFRIDSPEAEGPKVFVRLIALKTIDIMEKDHYEVRDGVVLETDMRQMDEGHTRVLKDLTEDRIKNLKAETQWFEMKSNAWGGLKYFLISKKLPQSEARHFLRTELERLKAGCAAFFKEGEKLGLERDDESKFVDRLRVPEGKPKLSDEEIQKLFAKMDGFGITNLEFSWGNKLCGVLQELLGD